MFGILATTLLLVLTLYSGVFLTVGNGALPVSAIPAGARGLIVPAVFLFIVLPYFGALLWSMFFSLLTRTVILALGLATIAMMASYGLMVASASVITGSRTYDNSVSAMQLIVASLIPCALVLFLLVVNYGLTYRWLTRVFFDQRSVRSPSFFRRFRIRRSGMDGGMTVEIGGEDRTAFEVVRPEIAMLEPPPRFGLNLLYITWGPNLLRHLRFLRWKEAFETRKLYLGFLLAAILVLLWSTSGQTSPPDVIGVLTFFIHAACLCCGVMAFRTEQTDRHFQRLADMGLRPGTVWLSKHLVWFVRVGLSIMVFLVAVTTWRLMTYGALEMRPLSAVWFHHPPSSGATHDVWLALELIGRVIVMMLTMYSIGQACSQLIRSAIVSLFVAFLIAVATFGWAVSCGFFGVPWILSVLPLAVGCMLVTWFRTRSWMLDDNRVRTWALPLGSIVAAITLAYIGTGMFRVYQIPWSTPFFSSADWSSASSELAGREFKDGLTGEQRTRVLAPVAAEERETLALYQRAADFLRQKTGVPQVRQPNSQKLESAETQLAREQAIAEWLEAMESARGILLEASDFAECAEFSPADANLITVTDSRAGESILQSVSGILFDAQHETYAAHPDVALDRYRSALKISRHAAGRGAEVDWRNSHLLTNRTLAGLREWGAQEDVGSELVERDIEIIDAHQKRMIPVEVVNYATALITRNTLDADAFTIAQLSGDRDQRIPMMLAMKFPGERARCHRLLNLREYYDIATLASYRSQQVAANAGTGKGLAKWYDGQVQTRDRNGIPSYINAEYMLRLTPIFALIAGQGAEQLCLQDIVTECEIRATKVLLSLLLMQRESKALPATLADFGTSLNDPWNNQPFDWHPQGLPGDLVSDGVTLVSANTPFLMTTHDGQVQIQEAGRQNPVHGLTAISPVSEAQDAQNQVANDRSPRLFTLGGRVPHVGREYCAIWKFPSTVSPVE